MTVAFPNGNWIPNTNQLGDTGSTLLAVVSEAIARYGSDSQYLAAFSFGTNPLAWRQEAGSSGYLILVAFDTYGLGKAGQKDYTYDDGAMGKYAFSTVQYTVEVYNPSPSGRGGLAPGVPAQQLIAEASMALLGDAYVAWVALRALSLGGVTTTPPALPIVQDKIHVGPMAPKWIGGLMGVSMTVECQL